MPELPRDQPRPADPPIRAQRQGCYAELRCRTNFSFLEGASHPDELVNRAAELGLAALAITDRNSVAGVVRAHVAAKDAGLKLIVGAEITPEDAPSVVLLATDRAAYGRLSTLITHGRRRADKGECRLTFDDVTRHADGLLACLPLVPCLDDDNGNWPNRYRECFGDRCYGLAELHRGPHDALRLDRMQRLAKTSHLPLAASNDVHYHVPERQPLQDVLTAVRYRSTVKELGQRRFSNAERHLKSADTMRQLFAAVPQAVFRTREIADRCTFSLDELRYEYPEELCPDERTPFDYLEQLTWEGANGRYPNGVPDKVRDQLRHELALIREMKYEAYFLTVWDLVKFARRKGILCQGRGSAANSAVCYCLEVTAVDPDRFETLFERFISRERDEPPDIDIDFEHERREEVIQYVYNKYGRDRAGMTGVVITYRTRSAIRDVGKALGFSVDRINRLSQLSDHTVPGETLADSLRQAGMDPTSRRSRQFLHLMDSIRHFPRHLSQHVGGLVFTRGPLSELVPIENATMADRTVVQWDKNDLDALGILKVDCLALGMLTAIRKSFDLVHGFEAERAQELYPPAQREGRRRSCVQQLRQGEGSCSSSLPSNNPLNADHSSTLPVPGRVRHHHETRDAEAQKLTLATIPADDQRVFDMICDADTVGVFQIESRAQMSMLPRLKPRCFYDLVIEVAIVRPGPIQGDMVHPYLRRRCGDEPETYPDERIRKVLHRTLGVPIFQEQAMQLAVVAAGFTPGEADQLRRAMGAWRKQGVIEKFREKFVNGILSNGYDLDFAERVFKQIRGFGEYGFPESHSASFAMLAWASAWLKFHHPAAFTAALLNSQPMGFYGAAQLVADARRHDVEVLPVDVCHSQWDCTLEVVRKKGTDPVNRKRVSPLFPYNGTGQRKGTDPLHAAGNSGDCDHHERVSLLSPALRLGFGMISGLSEAAAVNIVRVRELQPFQSFDDFRVRVRADAGVLSRLSRADAFSSLKVSRRAALWDSLPDQRVQPLYDEEPQQETPSYLPTMSEFSQIIADYRATGLSLKGHPLKSFRPQFRRMNIVAAAELERCETDRKVRVAGIVLNRQHPGTARGITFMTLEDETGTANLVVHPDVWSRFRTEARTAVAMIVRGMLQKESGVIHVVVDHLQDWSPAVAAGGMRSRDFR